ncbi:exonuclease [Brevibacillus sp. SYP-B805]|uniref:ribonuclease H-like domain-containing protein n=1 Tax=Brevibacillus sp. SYP-B805 TaxID=1578199 RepID=UPI0013ED99D2|nr:ribonuclease H-like domain-containing protein [Brevibacillus sp. SYP-B805]NGQ95841.1 exonuclease [Brevibacillus sp. SYP-B805]
MSLKSKLQRMKGHMGKESVRASAQETDVPYLGRWQAMHATPHWMDQAYVIIREQRYPITVRHGRYAFRELLDVIHAWNDSGLIHPLSAKGRKAEHLLFFDTETTGLHGGAGNTIFLLGYSRFEEDCVVVRQHFLPAPHAEVLLYQSFLADIRPSTDLVTFNGKAFDWPQVKTRHTLLRDEVPQLPTLGHYDLLHAARRLWKDELPSCRLSIIEREKLGVSRTGDVPGHLAPVLYFDYLQTKDPDIIRGVMEHHEMDVLSLISLYIHLAYLVLSHPVADPSGDELFEIARWYEALGADEEASRRYQWLIAHGHRRRAEAMNALCRLYKRQGNWLLALQLWEAYMREFSHIPEEVYVEAAKICEHHCKDYEKALYYTQQAFELWKRKGRVLRWHSKREQQQYVKRIERLERKVNRKEQEQIDMFGYGEEAGGSGIVD